MAANTGVVAPVYESRVSSGISSPGFFDWPKRVGEELPRLNPEIVVFVMGTNDWMTPQATPVDASGQPAWKAKYEAQVQAMVDTIARDGRTLYWVGPPILKDTKQEAGTVQVAQVIKSVVDRAPAAEYFDLHDLLDADDGTYTQTMDVDGRKVVVRAGDGIHLSLDGGDVVGTALFKRIDDQCNAQGASGRRRQADRGRDEGIHDRARRYGHRLVRLRLHRNHPGTHRRTHHSRHHAADHKRAGDDGSGNDAAHHARHHHAQIAPSKAAREPVTRLRTMPDATPDLAAARAAVDLAATIVDGASALARAARNRR